MKCGYIHFLSHIDVMSYHSVIILSKPLTTEDFNEIIYISLSKPHANLNLCSFLQVLHH